MIQESALEESHSSLGYLKKEADVAMEELKMEAKDTKKKKMMLEEELASDDSGEGVDSDDLDDDIEDNVEAVVMQQQQQAFLSALSAAPQM